MLFNPSISEKLEGGHSHIIWPRIGISILLFCRGETSFCMFFKEGQVFFLSLKNTFLAESAFRISAFLSNYIIKNHFQGAGEHVHIGHGEAHHVRVQIQKCTNSSRFLELKSNGNNK